MADHIFKCKHCNEEFIINERDFNCMILRHGSYKINYMNINPHLPKNECDSLFETGAIYGCGKPLKIIYQDNKYDIVICDYI